MSETVVSPEAAIDSEGCLIQRVAAGDRGAFSELYDRMQHRVLGLATRVLRDRAQAEEVAQEVFLEVWQLAARYEADKGNAVGWILRKTHSKAVDRVRSSEARHARDRRVGIRDLNEHESSLADVVELRLEGERISRALDTLPESQRQVVVLAHLNGYSHAEVSAMLRIPVGTVKTRIRTGISRLREEMAAA